MLDTFVSQHSLRCGPLAFERWCSMFTSVIWYFWRIFWGVCVCTMLICVWLQVSFPVFRSAKWTSLSHQLSSTLRIQMPPKVHPHFRLIKFIIHHTKSHSVLFLGWASSLNLMRGICKFHKAYNMHVVHSQRCISSFTLVLQLVLGPKYSLRRYWYRNRGLWTWNQLNQDVAYRVLLTELCLLTSFRFYGRFRKNRFPLAKNEVMAVGTSGVADFNSHLCFLIRHVDCGPTDGWSRTRRGRGIVK